MKKVEEQKHFLALMALPGDFALIDISKLDIANGYYPLTLAHLDTFTMTFSKNEIMESIKRSNIVDKKYMNGTLVIQDNQKHNPIAVIDKDLYDNFQIDEFLRSKENDKNGINNIINKFGAIVKDKEISSNFKTMLRMGNINGACQVLFGLPYLEQRKFILYLLDIRNKEKMSEKQHELIRDKVA